MLIINATIKNTIDRIIFLKDIKIKQTKDISFDNDCNKLDIINALQNGNSFNISENEIYIEVARTKEEIKKDIDHYKLVNKCSISRLKKWSENEEYRNQIIKYLTVKKLDWILKELI